jgi:hypothetical protein
MLAVICFCRVGRGTRRSGDLATELGHYPDTAGRQDAREWSHLVELAGQLAGFPATSLSTPAAW